VDLAALRLDAYKPPEIGIDCSRCRRRAFASTAKLGARYGKAITLGDLARRVAADGNPPCALAAVEGNVLCGAVPVEPPIESWADLGQALHGRWVALLQCGRRHAAMKSTKACPGPITLDVETLVASLGHDQKLDRLPSRLRCPSCGTRVIHVEWLIPPPAPPPEPIAGPARAMEGETFHRPARQVTARALRVIGG
jgi:hypothetical protein